MWGISKEERFLFFPLSRPCREFSRELRFLFFLSTWNNLCREVVPPENPVAIGICGLSGTTGTRFSYIFPTRAYLRVRVVLLLFCKSISNIRGILVPVVPRSVQTRMAQGFLAIHTLEQVRR
jgi:hypothetical protein